MIKIIKVGKLNNSYEKYHILEDNHLIGHFVAYDNKYHSNNKYISPLNETFNTLNDEQYIKAVKDYFNQPLQVVVDSKEKEIIKKLKELGFSLKRETFERTYYKKDFILKNIGLIEIEFYDKGSLEYEKAANIAYEHYLKTHKKVNPYTGTLEDFLEILPEQVICQTHKNKIINLSFVDNNEFCYWASNERKSFETFAYTLIVYMFSRHDMIELEVDSTDYIARQIKAMFHDNNKDSIKTFIFE
ncbi:MAG: hypothetical protein ACOX56_06955 [Acholeplasmataceae bacterium]